MNRKSRLYFIVCAVTVLAVAAFAAAWDSHPAFPGWWPFLTFLFISILLDGLNTQLRVAAKGTTSFIVHMASALLFGGFWGVCIAGISTLFGEIGRGNAPVKMVFNISQRMLAIALAVMAYQAMGGQLPPAYLLAGRQLASEAVQRDLGLFFVFAAVYFAVNSVAVSMVVSLSSDRSFREVWRLNTRGVIGYDLGASVVAVLIAFIYSWSDAKWHFGSAGLIVIIIPIVAVRHVYGLYHQLQESGQELLQVMVKAIEARDPYTSGHSLRVSQMSRTIAVELGLPASAVEQVETAALLHDVGKIHEEFAPLLRKEARLTDEETALMQTHSTKSAELVGIISKFHGFVQDSVRHHHERWDGQGYPAGLTQGEIPLASRIILVCDTIDAMTTDRPYRKRLSLDVVIAELQKCKGTQFDPSIVDVVVSSVAVRRLIAGSEDLESVAWAPTRSKRVSWPAAALWKAKRA